MYYQIPETVTDILGERTSRLICFFREFFIEASRNLDEDIQSACQYFVPKVVEIFKEGLLGTITQMEKDLNCRLSLENRASGKNLSIRDSFSLVTGLLKTLRPSQIADLVGKTVTSLNLLKREVALKVFSSTSATLKKWLWSLHKLIDQQTRSLITSKVFYYFPNTARGKIYPEDVCRQISETIYREYNFISLHRNGLENGPCRDLLTEVLTLDFFEIYQEKRNFWRNLLPSEVDARLRDRYPKHRRSQPAKFAASLGTLQDLSLMLRIELSRFNDHDEQERRVLSQTETVISILSDKAIRTGILLNFGSL
jgi:hypothetical protein